MIDPQQFKLFQQAYDIGQHVVELVKHHKADVALLGILAATALLRRKTSFTLDELLERLRAIDSAVDLIAALTPKKSAGSNG